ncbi:hypothetical protein WSM22_35720 [Cytophagales bacterium WSM2-2]|nr:hypothetical protein WSM22_35720 [Cytophagales bacterium WSM2-2]
MQSFQTTDIGGNQCTFQYEVVIDEFDSNEITFRVFSMKIDPMRWFSYRFKILNKTTAKGEMATCNDNSEFSRKGIPEKIIEIAAQHLNRSIISSPLNPVAGDYLVGPSVKMWERLVVQNGNACRTDEHFIFRHQN